MEKTTKEILVNPQNLSENVKTLVTSYAEKKENKKLINNTKLYKNLDIDERLERIKQSWKGYHLRKSDVDWLIKQVSFVQRLEKHQCPNCFNWEDYRAKHCHICDGTRFIYVEYKDW